MAEPSPGPQDPSRELGKFYEDIALTASLVFGTTSAACIALVDYSRGTWSLRGHAASSCLPSEVSIASNHSGLLESTIFLIDDDEPVWEDVGTNRAHSTRVLIIEDTSTDERAWTCPFYAGAPLQLKCGTVVGVLCVIDSEPRQPGPLMGEALLALARQVSVRIDAQAGIEQLMSSVVRLRNQNVELQEQLMENRKLAHTAELAELAVNQRRHFTECMSHEIRTPLHTVAAAASLLAADPYLPDEQRELADMILVGVQRLEHIVSDILSYDALETSGADPPDLSDVDVRNGLLPEVEAFLWGPGPDSSSPLLAGRSFESSVDPGVPPAVLSDRSRLRQVLLVLARNAVKFSSSDGTLALTVDIVDGQDGPERGAAEDRPRRLSALGDCDPSTAEGPTEQPLLEGGAELLTTALSGVSWRSWGWDGPTAAACWPADDTATEPPPEAARARQRSAGRRGQRSSLGSDISKADLRWLEIVGGGCRQTRRESCDRTMAEPTAADTSGVCSERERRRSAYYCKPEPTWNDLISDFKGAQPAEWGVRRLRRRSADAPLARGQPLEPEAAPALRQRRRSLEASLPQQAAAPVQRKTRRISVDGGESRSSVAGQVAPECASAPGVDGETRSSDTSEDGHQPRKLYRESSGTSVGRIPGQNSLGRRLSVADDTAEEAERGRSEERSGGARRRKSSLWRTRESGSGDSTVPCDCPASVLPQQLSDSDNLPSWVIGRPAQPGFRQPSEGSARELPRSSAPAPHLARGRSAPGFNGWEQKVHPPAHPPARRIRRLSVPDAAAGVTPLVRRRAGSVSWPPAGPFADTAQCSPGNAGGRTDSTVGDHLRRSREAAAAAGASPFHSEKSGETARRDSKPRKEGCTCSVDGDCNSDLPSAAPSASALPEAIEDGPSSSESAAGPSGGERSGAFIRFVLSDDGIGIRPGMLERIFLPYTQGEQTARRAFGGTGLGLAIARRLAESLGGSLTASSAGPGQGAAFTLLVPLLPAVGEPLTTGQRRISTAMLSLARPAIAAPMGDLLESLLPGGPLAAAKALLSPAIARLAASASGRGSSLGQHRHRRSRSFSDVGDLFTGLDGGVGSPVAIIPPVGRPPLLTKAFSSRPGELGRRIAAAAVAQHQYQQQQQQQTSHLWAHTESPLLPDRRRSSLGSHPYSSIPVVPAIAGSLRPPAGLLQALSLARATVSWSADTHGGESDFECPLASPSEDAEPVITTAVGFEPQLPAEPQLLPQPAHRPPPLHPRPAALASASTPAGPGSLSPSPLAPAPAPAPAPARLSPSPSLSPSTSANPASAAASPRPPVRILVAEDERLCRVVMQKMLNQIGGVEVTFAENGKLMVEAFVRAPFDLILTDYNMPLMTGIEATRAIKEMAMATGRDVNVVAVSANATEDQIQQFYDAGMVASLSKPVTMSGLRAIIEQYGRAPPPRQRVASRNPSTRSLPSTTCASVVSDAAIDAVTAGRGGAVAAAVQRRTVSSPISSPDRFPLAAEGASGGGSIGASALFGSTSGSMAGRCGAAADEQHEGPRTPVPKAAAAPASSADY